MLFNEYPYINKEEILNRKPLQLFKNLELNELLSKILVIEPEKRITWDEYFSHPFFKIEEENSKKERKRLRKRIEF